MPGARLDYRWVVFLVGLTQLVITTDFSIVAVALPSIGAQLHIPPASLSWVISAAALSGGGFLILAGRAADIFGQRACMLTGLALFAAGSLGAALAPSLPFLIAARVLQGLGGAVLTPANFSLINTLVPEGALRRRAMGVFGLMQGVSLVIGLLLGGALTTHFGWRAVFLLNPPIVLLAMALAWRAVPARLQGAKTEESRIDWLGAALIVTGMTLVLLGVSAMGREGVTAMRPLALLAGGVLGFILFFIVETRVAAPLAPPSMFGHRNFTSATAILMLHLAGIGGVFVLLSLYMQTGLKMSAMRSGLGMMPYAIAVMAAGQAAPTLMGRFSHRAIAFVTLGLYVLGLGLLAMLSGAANYWIAVALGGVVTAFGATTAFMALMAEGTSDIPHAQQGAASAVLFTAQQIGIPLGATIALSVLGFAGGHGLGAFKAAYLVVAAIIIGALVIALATLRPVHASPPPTLVPS